MKAHLLIATVSCVTAGMLNAQEASPGVTRASAPPPRPHPVATNSAVVAPQARPQSAFTPSLAGPHGLRLGTYRSVPNYTARQFQPTISRRAPATSFGVTPANRNANELANTGAAAVTPRIAAVPQQNTMVAPGTRSANSDRGIWNATTRTWNRPGTANTNVITGGTNATSTTSGNNWRTRSPHNYVSWQDARSRYDHRPHDRDWWRRNHNTIVLVNGGYYYWDAGWWYPAWGYDPAAQYYAYDGPIYGYDGLPPDQVIANVQTMLQQQGYYRGMVDGELGPMTRQAIADWQRDHGLAITTAIDYPTLASLGLS